MTPLALEILLAVAEEERHGYDIMVSVERRTGGRLSPNPGTLYRALDRLAGEGLLEVVERRSVPQVEARKLFRLSRLGRRVATAEAERLADQVGAARRLLRRPGGAS
jgi:DNA-binding PadR family transcriptional regulator